MRLLRSLYETYFRPPTFVKDGVEYPVRDVVEIVGGAVEDDATTERTRLTVGGSGGSPGGALGQVQAHGTGDAFIGSPAIEVDPDNGVAMRFRGVVRYPSATGIPSTGFPKPIGVAGGFTGYTDPGWGTTHCLAFGTHSYADDEAQYSADVDILPVAHKGLVQVVALGVAAAAGLNVRILARRYDCDSSGTVTWLDATPIDMTPPEMINTSPTLPLTIIAQGPFGGDGIPYISVSAGGDGAEAVRWAGQVQITMVVPPP